MGITRLNHAVLYVRDAQRTAAFYEEVLGFRRLPIGPEGFTGAVFLQAPNSTNDFGQSPSNTCFNIAEAGIATCRLTRCSSRFDSRKRSSCRRRW